MIFFADIGDTAGNKGEVILLVACVIALLIGLLFGFCAGVILMICFPKLRYTFKKCVCNCKSSGSSGYENLPM